MKKVLAIVLILALVFALCACGGKPASNGTQKTDTPQSGGGEDAAVVDDNPYNIDFKAEGEQEMSSDRLTKAELKAAYDYFVGLEASERKSLTYKDMVEYIGCEASAFYGPRSYIWYASDNNFSQMNATFMNDSGEWSNPVMSAGNLS